MVRTLLLPFVVTTVVVAATLALVDGTALLLLGYLCGVLVVGPWLTGFVAARAMGAVPRSPRAIQIGASLLTTVVVIAVLIAVLGLGVLVGAGFATAIGAGAGVGLGPVASIRKGWSAASEHLLAAALTLASWFGALAALVVGDSMRGELESSPGALVFVSVAAAFVVVASNRRWARAAAEALSQP